MRFSTQRWLALLMVFSSGAAMAACGGSKDKGTGSAPVAAPTAGTLAPTPPAAGTSGTAPTAGSTAPDTGDVPCAVAAILKQHCVRCHGNTLREGAPISLVDSASFRRDSGGQTIGASTLMRVRGSSRPMPPAPAMLLTAAEIATLEGWIGPGAPATHPGCSVDDTPAPPTAGSGSGVTIVRTAGTGAAGNGGSAGTSAPVGGATAPGPVEPGATGNWTMFGSDLGNSRNNAAEKTLGVSNVKGLRELWTFNGAGTTSTPAVVDGTIYLPSWDGKVHAMRLDDGMPVWTATLPDLIDSSPAVTATQVFVSDDNGSLHALDRASGKVQWSQAVDPHPETHLWSSPIFIPDANIVVVGVASGEEAVTTPPTFRGSVVALDAMTGMVRWRFVTADAAKGSGPGIAVWGTAAVDTKRKALYVGTGNNYAAPSGELADSMLAINYETGALVWSRQFTPDDIFTVFAMTGPDFDIGSSANLFSIDGVDYVGIGVKNGNYYALERDTGAVKWMAAITTGGVLGGVISASAYANGMIFVASNEMLMGRNQLAAINAKDGMVLWKHPSPSSTYGAVSHANGVVYMGTDAGSVFAVDGANGTMLWVDQTPNMQPIAGGAIVSQGKLLVPWGYRWTLREGVAGAGGLTVYGL